MSGNSYNNGRNDAAKGKGPANTNNMHYLDREKYNAGYAAQQKQNNNKK